MKRLILALAVVPTLLLAAELENSTIAKLRARAEQGVAGAQFNLAEMYASGYGVPKDPTVAATWYQKSAEQGYGEAEFTYAMACLEGRGRPKDPVEGLAWVIVAAKAGGASLVKFRDQLEQQFGPEGSAAAQKRSRELLALIDTHKRAKTEGR